MTAEGPRVRLEDLEAGEDSYAWALRAFRAAALAESRCDAWIDVGAVLERLEPAALLDVAITMALLPAVLPGRAVAPPGLDWLTAQLALRDPGSSS